MADRHLRRAAHAHDQEPRRITRKRDLLGLLLFPLALLACGQDPPVAAPRPGPIQFATLTHSPAINSVLLTGDLNHDGTVDLIGDGGAFFSGNGDGSFTRKRSDHEGAPDSTDLSQITGPILVAELTGDEHLDLVSLGTIPLSGNRTVQLHRGRGDGTFELPRSTEPRTIGAELAGVIDLDGDGRLELLVRPDPFVLEVYRGTPAGTLTLMATVRAEWNPGPFHFVDVNGDHRVDIVALSETVLGVFAQDTAGAFAPPTLIMVPSADRLLKGDLNGDGVTDLVLTRSQGSSVTVLLGQGSGELGAPHEVDLFAAGTIVDLSDLDGDGRLDLLSSNADEVRLHRGNGDGTFAPPFALGLSPWLNRPVVLDVNGDRRPDLLFTRQEDQSPFPGSGLSVVLNQGDRRFLFAPFFSQAEIARATAIGDLNGDGKPDLLGGTNRGLNVLLGTGRSDYKISASQDLPARPTALTLADLNGDQRQDLLSRDSNGAVFVQYGNGDGTFTAPARVASPRDPVALAVGDLNHDGFADLVMPDRDQDSLSILFANRDGGFAAPLRLDAAVEASGPAEGLAIGDLNRDGHLDLLVSLPGRRRVSVFLGDGSGGLTFRGAVSAPATPPRVIQQVARPTPLRLEDLNHDGKLDLVCAWGLDQPFVALGLGDGSFAPAQALALPGQSPIVTFALADLDRDGHQDLVFLSDGALVLRGRGDGSFDEARRFSDGSPPPSSLLIGDADEDGKPDLFLVNGYATSFLRNVTR